MLLKLNKLIILLAFCNYSYGQIPGPDRLTDWSEAGIESSLPVYRHSVFEGYSTDSIDNAPLLRSILDTIKAPTIILFGEGNFLFNSSINLPSGVVLKGLGNNKTKFIFNQAGRNEPSIIIRGTEDAKTYPLQAAAKKNEHSIELDAIVASKLQPGETIRLIQNDSDLVYSNWSLNQTGQVVKVDSIREGKIFISSQLRMDYPLSREPRIRIIKPVEFSGVECMNIIRQDYANGDQGSSNFYIRNAANCWISSVESEKCNSGHVEISHSRNLLIEDNYFHDAHDFGSGGRAYGVVLQFATGDVLVQNNIFRRLRHAMMVQGGANGNVFAYNYAYQGRKEIMPGIYMTGEDMVCHGNYPYLNLFEGNYGQYASNDNSHGKNGPYNTWFRNIATTLGFNITNAESPYQNITGNHRLGGSNIIQATNHQITDNSWQGISTLTHPSLFYSTPPDFLSAIGLGKIGPPTFNISATIPARERAISQMPISRKCDLIIWEGQTWKYNMAPSTSTMDYHLIISKGAKVELNHDVHIKQVTLENQAHLIMPREIMLQVGDKIE